MKAATAAAAPSSCGQRHLQIRRALAIAQDDEFPRVGFLMIAKIRGDHVRIFLATVVGHAQQVDRHPEFLAQVLLALIEGRCVGGA